MSELNRVRWRCRRGLLELDLVLSSFVRNCYSDLSVEQQQAFRELLDYPDPELWDLVCARAEPASKAQSEVMEVLRRAPARSGVLTRR